MDRNLFQESLRCCNAYEAAIQHHGSSSVLLQMALTAFERTKESPEKVDDLWRLAKGSISDADAGRSLYTTYVFLLKRRVVKSGSGDFSIVETAFEDGYKSLKKTFEDWDSGFRYRLMYAHFLFKVTKNVDRARKVLEDIMASGGSTHPKVVIEAVTYERNFGMDISRCRQMLCEAVNWVSEDAEVLFEYFVQFEREEGTLEELDTALEKVNLKASRLREQKKLRKTLRQKKRKGGESGPGIAAEKHSKRKQLLEGQAVPAKAPEETPTLPNLSQKEWTWTWKPQPRNLSPNLKSPKLVTRTTSSAYAADRAAKNNEKTIFVSNLVPGVTKKDVLALFENVEDIRLSQKGTRVNGSVDFKTVEDASEALRKDNFMLKGQKVFTNLYKPAPGKAKKEAKQSEDKRKLFVSNVHFSCTEDEVKESLCSSET
ncbi:hypothetical protein L596_023405 [Steinernema carpocapsae]|uniref:RRM domain-containing protein n=1 Tax=Steinernema carpocapsae TaxID=34508 RepID=A0A4U5MDJ1_STECR|nr:hypothetical protein L596_023405 [Steinernema carpocapsae]